MGDASSPVPSDGGLTQTPGGIPIVSEMNAEGQEIKRLADSSLWEAATKAADNLGEDQFGVYAFSDLDDVRLGVVYRHGKSGDLTFVGTLTHGLRSNKGWAGEVGLIWKPF